MSRRAAGRTRGAGAGSGTVGATRHVVRGSSTVSTASAARFAARVRRRRWARAAVALGVLLLIAGVCGLGLYSPWSTVHRIRVTGTQRIPAATVQALLADQRGRPLLLVDTGELAARIAALRLVAGVSVHRSWPSGLAVTVRERQAVAAVPAGTGVKLVDRDGVEVDTARRAPTGLPLVQVDLATAEPGSLAAVLDTLAAMPAALHDQVRSVGAATPEGIWLVLADGSRVQWGASAQTARKAAVLARLRATPAASSARGTVRRYDVSAPDAPAVVASP